MDILLVDTKKDISELQKVALSAFANSEDVKIDTWFSFDYMQKMIEEKRGLALKAVIKNSIEGFIYGQQENPINAKEGEEKWVIIFLGINTNAQGKGLGSNLLKEFENNIKNRGVEKLFIFTNESDDIVINFYKKNGYIDAGIIKNYQYGKNNNAIFLLKYL